MSTTELGMAARYHERLVMLAAAGRPDHPISPAAVAAEYGRNHGMTAAECDAALDRIVGA